jgi:hypothetical protein
MIAADFYRVSESVLAPALLATGWEPSGRGIYRKADAVGVSRFALDPLKRFEHFRVLVTFDPTDIQEVLASLRDPNDGDAATGFLCGPYLTPGGVNSHHRGYACRTTANLEASLAVVVHALETVGVPWLQQLRDPQFLAEQADPTAALVCGYAWERAGNMERATERYREMLRRLDLALGGLTLRQLDRVDGCIKRQYEFIARRLGYDTDLATRYAKAQGEGRGGPTRS